jgi:hypothetical protein
MHSSKITGRRQQNLRPFFWPQGAAMTCGFFDALSHGLKRGVVAMGLGLDDGESELQRDRKQSQPATAQNKDVIITD